jgi:hypothetical protein
MMSAEAGEQGRPVAEAGADQSITPAVRQGRGFDLPDAPITALIPVGVERITGMPSSARGAAPGEMLRRTPAPEPRVVRRVEDEVGLVATIDHLAGKKRSRSRAEAGPLPPRVAEIDRARPGPEAEVNVAGAPTRQANADSTVA